MHTTCTSACPVSTRRRNRSSVYWRRLATHQQQHRLQQQPGLQRTRSMHRRPCRRTYSRHTLEGTMQEALPAQIEHSIGQLCVFTFRVRAVMGLAVPCLISLFVCALYSCPIVVLPVVWQLHRIYHLLLYTNPSLQELACCINMLTGLADWVLKDTSVKSRLLPSLTSFHRTLANKERWHLSVELPPLHACMHTDCACYSVSILKATALHCQADTAYRASHFQTSAFLLLFIVLFQVAAFASNAAHGTSCSALSALASPDNAILVGLRIFVRCCACWGMPGMCVSIESRGMRLDPAALLSAIWLNIFTCPSSLHATVTCTCGGSTCRIM